MERFLTLRVALIALAAVLASFGIANGWVAVFWQSKYEVTYHFDVSVNYCVRQRCAFSATLQVANTGRRKQGDVVVRLTGVPARFGGPSRVSDLSAAEPRESDPRIEQHQVGDTRVIELHDLTPGTLARFYFQGQIAASDEASAKNPAIAVKGRGRMIEGDPRAITFGRFF